MMYWHLFEKAINQVIDGMMDDAKYHESEGKVELSLAEQAVAAAFGHLAMAYREEHDAYERMKNEAIAKQQIEELIRRGFECR